jgi:hypothetical protein
VVAFDVIIANFPDGYTNFLDDNSVCLGPGEASVISGDIATRWQPPPSDLPNEPI